MVINIVDANQKQRQDEDKQLFKSRIGSLIKDVDFVDKSKAS